MTTNPPLTLGDLADQLRIPAFVNGTEIPLAYGQLLEAEDGFTAIKMIRAKDRPRYRAFIRKSTTASWVQVGGRMTSADQAFRVADDHWTRQFGGF